MRQDGTINRRGRELGCACVAVLLVGCMLATAAEGQARMRGQLRDLLQQANDRTADALPPEDQAAAKVPREEEAEAVANAYDPLAEPADVTVQTLDLTVHDAKRNRDIPVRVYLPKHADGTAPGTGANGSQLPGAVVLFSHGLGGSRANNPHLGEHWAKRGLVAVFMQHVGSDESVWQGAGLGQRMAAMKKAANAQNAVLRYLDVPAVLDQLAVWNADETSPLYQAMDMNRVGMSGHSFGAVTTQAVIGQRFGALGAKYLDERLKAAVVFSPSGPRMGSADQAFGGIAMPVLLMTGTQDVSPIGGESAADRLQVFPALPEGDAFELVLKDGTHSFLASGAVEGDAPQARLQRFRRQTANPHHSQCAVAFSTAFWDAYLNGDAAAKAWLKAEGKDEGAQAMLEEGDRWQVK